MTAFLLLISSLAHAFPEMVRHGYVNCTACHVSPNGGGVLTAYGRELSREVLSTWGSENEALWMVGILRAPDWLSLGGDLRVIQTYLSNERVNEGKFIVMQADAEVAARAGRIQIVATLGREETSSYNPSGDTPFSRRHFLLYQPTDAIPIQVRLGKFQTAFGINTPDHWVATKRALRWDEGSETYNIEGSFLGENYDAFVTLGLGRPDRSTLDLEKGVAARSSFSLHDKHKIGVSYYYGEDSSGSRHVYGPFAILGFTPRWFALAEIDFQNSRSGRGSQFGAANYLRLDYEVLQGLHTYVSQEFSRLDFGNARNTREGYGLGVQFFPRPHFELHAAYQKTRVRASSDSFSDFAWIVFHYYL